MKYTIKSVRPEYTGGGIYVFTGRLTDGNCFMADTSHYDVRIVNADPDVPEEMSEEEAMKVYGCLNEDVWADVEWQEEHLVEDLCEPDALKFFRQILFWINNNRPNGNYLMADIDRIYEDISELIKDYESGPHYFVTYAEDSDITFVMREHGSEIRVSGFYFGKPDAESTEYFKDKPTATKGW